MKLFFTILFFTIRIISFGQNPSQEWIVRYGMGDSYSNQYDANYYHSCVVDTNGNLFTCGNFLKSIDTLPGLLGQGDVYCTPSVFSTNTFIVKHASNGSLLWIKRIGGGGGDASYDLQIDNFGNIYILLFYTSSTDFDPGVGVVNLTGSGFSNLAILKLNNNGDFVWVNKIICSGFHNPGNISIDNYGGISVTGCYSGEIKFGATNIPIGPITISGNVNRYYVLKLDSSGNYQWSKTFGDTQPLEEIHHLKHKVDDDKNLILVANFIDSVDVDPGPGIVQLPLTNYQSFILKLDSLGNYKWVKVIPTSVKSIVIDNNNDIITTGWGELGDIDPGPGVFDITNPNLPGSESTYILKLDSAGNTKFVKAFVNDLTTTGVPSCFDEHECQYNYGQYVNVDNNNNIYITGAFSGKTDFDPDSPATFKLRTRYVNTNLNEEPDGATYCAKLDANGNFKWANCITGYPYPTSKSKARGKAIAVDLLGNVYNVGDLWDTLDTNPGPLVSISYFGSNYIQKIKQCTTNPITVTQNSSSLACNQTASSYLWVNCDSVYSPAAGSNTSQTYTPTSYGGSYAVIVTDNGCTEISPCVNYWPLGVEDLDGMNSVFVYPNPTKDEVNIKFKNLEKKVTLTVKDLNGRIVTKNEYLNSSNHHINLNGLHLGLYFLRIETETFNNVIKIIKD